jgi:ComF family protein
MDHLIQLLKFQGQLAAATLLGNLLQEMLTQRTAPLPEALLPVPLHPKRLAERGFNQALEIARVVSKPLAIPIIARTVQRHRPTPPQVSLNAKARRSNVRGAFRRQQLIQAKHVAIIDDVITTGSTVTEIAGVLKKAGVEEIEVWALARTPVNVIPKSS